MLTFCELPTTRQTESSSKNLLGHDDYPDGEKVRDLVIYEYTAAMLLNNMHLKRQQQNSKSTTCLNTPACGWETVGLLDDWFVNELGDWTVYEWPVKDLVIEQFNSWTAYRKLHILRKEKYAQLTKEIGLINNQRTEVTQIMMDVTCNMNHGTRSW